MKRSSLILLALTACQFFSCSADDNSKVVYTPPTSTTPPNETPVVTPPVGQKTIKHYMALGDSYTIGQSVCETCRFPAQLELGLETNTNLDVQTDIIATTGWTTSNLISAIAAQNPPMTYDLVTLLIGVNNQYQQKPFSLYESEFPALLQKAIALAKGDKARVIVVSIPDYGFTPFGMNSNMDGHISTEIDHYNTFAKDYATAQGILFVNITDITRNGLNDPTLVTTDGLHPSQKAYSLFVERLIMPAKTIVNQ